MTPRNAEDRARRLLALSGRAGDAPLVRIGADRGFTGVLFRATTPDGPLVVKVPDPAWMERAAREACVLAELGPGLPIEMPRLLASARGEEPPAPALLMAEIPGEPGDAERPFRDAARAEALLDVVARLHASRWRDAGLAAHPWLPRWGEGTRGRAAPHRRRTERCRRRIGRFLARHGAGAAPGFAALLEAVRPRLERDLARVAALPTTLIHGDLHLDNVIEPPDRPPVLIDWQSASRGPGLYDVARLLLQSADGASEARRGLERWIARLAAADVPEEDLRDSLAAWPAMIRVVVAGFVSGYAGRDPATMIARERRLVARDASARGLAGTALDLLRDAGSTIAP